MFKKILSSDLNNLFIKRSLTEVNALLGKAIADNDENEVLRLWGELVRYESMVRDGYREYIKKTCFIIPRDRALLNAKMAEYFRDKGP